MTILEAIKTGKPFKRAVWANYLYAESEFTLKESDITAEDWEIQVPVTTLTAKSLIAAWDEVATARKDVPTSSDPKFLEIFSEVSKLLGLGE